MRLFFLLVAVVTLGQTAAIAQGQECKAVADPSMRLACYDKAAPPVATQAPRPAVRTDPTSKIEATEYVDPIGTENALLHERINGICRGC